MLDQPMTDQEATDFLQTLPTDTENLLKPGSINFETLERLVPSDLIDAKVIQTSTKVRDGVQVNIHDLRLDETAIRSFKGAGAYVAMLRAKTNGATEVVASSAGNHAQGVALAANKLELPATIFMPVGTSPAKIDATRRLGGNWVTINEIGKNFDQAKAAADRMLSENSDATSIHPFDDIDVIIGQGVHMARAVRIFQETRQKIDAVLLGVGGGGLLAGTLVARQNLSPETHVLAVEEKGSDSMALALEEGAPTTIPDPAKYGQGTGVGTAGTLNYEVVKPLWDETTDRTIQITPGSMAVAVTQERKLGRNVETSGALGRAALSERLADETITQIIHRAKSNRQEVNIVNFVTGGNITPQEQVQREKEAEVSLGKRKYLQIELNSDTPGQLKWVAEIFGQRDINIIRLKYKPHEEISDNRKPVLTIGVQSDDPAKIEDALNQIDELHRVNDLSYSEVPKLGISDPECRFLTQAPLLAPGSKPKSIELPQYPGTLLTHLQNLPPNKNITYLDFEQLSREGDVAPLEIAFENSFQKTVRMFKRLFKF